MNTQARLDRLVALSAVVAAGGTVGFTQNAEAAVISSGVVNINVPTTTAGVYLNVVTGVAAASPAGSPGWDLNPWGTGSLFVYANNPASSSDGIVSGAGSSTALVDNLAIGTLVDGTSVFARNGGVETTGATAFVLNSSDNYIGFRFTNEANGNSVHFGWARFSVAGTLAGQPRTLVEYAYEDQAGVGISVGLVPAPGTAAILALGAVGMAGRRRK